MCKKILIHTASYLYLGLLSAQASSLNLIEQILTPSQFSIEKVNDWKDSGGLNDTNNNSLFGVAISSISIDQEAGKINSAELLVSKTVVVKAIREAIEKLCKFNNDDWKIRRGNDDYQAGDGNGEVCKVNYLPQNSSHWNVLIEYK